MPNDTNTDPFKPTAPQIPGVPADVHDKNARTKRLRAQASGSRQTSLRIGLSAGAVVIALGIAWWVRSSSVKPAAAPPPSVQPAAAPEPVKPKETLPVGPGPIANASELAKAWSSKRFNFRDPVTSDATPALAVRLPGDALWGISLRDAYGTCELEYVTKLAELRSKYNVAAEHPMVVNPCTRAVFDLSRYGSGPHGLVRGELVRGRAVRPPIAIEMEERGNKVVAVRME